MWIVNSQKGRHLPIRVEHCTTEEVALAVFNNLTRWCWSVQMSRVEDGVTVQVASFWSGHDFGVTK